MLLSGNTPSKRFELSYADLGKVLKVVIYSAIAAGLSALIALLPQIDVPTAYVWLIPAVNAVLVAGKKFFENNK